MARRVKAFDIWKAMSMRALVRLSFAVFLMFSIFGPLSVLMESELHVVSWRFVAVQCLASGGLAGTIILLGRQRWYVILLAVLAFTSVIALQNGGISFQYGQDGLRVALGENIGLQARRGATLPVSLDPEQLRAIYEQRAALGLLAVALLVGGYVMFLRVIRAEVQQRSRLETEVRIAREIQESLLPSGPFTTPWCAAAGTALPATEVAGDFYDIVALGDDRAAFAIADVTGHGVGAGILGAMTKSALRAQLLHAAEPAPVLATVNATIQQLSDERTFVTFAYCLAERTSRVVRYATAGHPPVLHVRGRVVTPLRTVNLALGMRAATTFASGELAYEPGDLLVLYTDGVLEARDASGAEFGAERLAAAVAAGSRDPSALCSRILDELGAFTRSTSFQDDVSLLVIRLS